MININPTQSSRKLRQLCNFLLVDWGDFWKCCQAAIPKGKWLTGLFLVMVIAILSRFPLTIMQPMSHDESYTYIAFASQPITTIISDYHLPNNHIFHSVLVHFSTQFLGDHPFGVRFPAFIAGLFVVLTVYLITRAQYGEASGLLAASITAVIKTLAENSAEARGYSILTALVLFEFLLAMYLRQNRNLWGWLFFSIIGALGFFTVPVMLYPFGVICLWLGFCGLSKDIGPGYRSRWNFWGWLLGAGIQTSFLTAILYSPVLKYSGFDALFNNPFVTSLTLKKFLHLLPDRIAETWDIWQAGTGSLLWLMLIGFGLSVFFYKPNKCGRIPPQAGLIWIPIIALIQRPNPWPKIFVYLLPLLIIWGTGGWVSLFGKWIKHKYLNIMILILSGIILVLGVIRDVPKFFNLPGEPCENELAAMIIAEQIDAGDALVVGSPNDAPVWYYAHIHGISKEAYTHLEEREIDRIYVLVNPGEGQTIDSVLKERNLDPAHFDFSSSEMLMEWKNTRIFILENK